MNSSTREKIQRQSYFGPIYPRYWSYPYSGNKDDWIFFSEAMIEAGRNKIKRSERLLGLAWHHNLLKIYGISGLRKEIVHCIIRRMKFY